jgi:hypothetical protein
MNRNKKIIIITTVCVGALLLLGTLASTVGNVGIRRVPSHTTFPLVVSEPVMLGVETTVRWAVFDPTLNRMVAFRLRTIAAEEQVGTAQFRDGAATIVLPCTTDRTRGTLSMVDASTDELITWTSISLLPPGPDCVR